MGKNPHGNLQSGRITRQVRGNFKSLFHSISGTIKLDLHFSTSTQPPFETIFSMSSVKAPSMEVLCPNMSL